MPSKQKSPRNGKEALYACVHLGTSLVHTPTCDITQRLLECPWLAILVKELRVATLLGQALEPEVSALACCITQCTSLRIVDIRGLVTSS